MADDLGYETASLWIVFKLRTATNKGVWVVCDNDGRVANYKRAMLTTIAHDSTIIDTPYGFAAMYESIAFMSQHKLYILRGDI